MFRAVRHMFASPNFFWGVVGLLVFQALWLVFSAAYPMAFDEDFHFGIIKIYASQWSPFLAEHPAGADVFGAVTRDPSYLFHYLMSFPYRVVAALTDSQTAIVIALRVLNVAMFTAGLVLWRKVLRRTPLSNAAINCMLLLFVLVPIVPQLAAHINYDNALMPLTAGLFLLALRLQTALRTGTLPLYDALLFVLLGMVGGLIKYAFLPIFVAAGLCVFVFVALQVRHGRLKLRAALAAGWRALALPAKIILIALIVLAGGLMAERYGLNALRYGEPIPDCADVLTVEQCLHYGPWGRDYLLEQQKDPAAEANPILFGVVWAYSMWYRLFFAVNGNTADFMYRYQNFPPLPWVGMVGALLILGGLSTIIAKWRNIIRQPTLLLFTVTSVFYMAVLWLQNYQMYVQTAHAVAINGRYLLLVMLPLAAVALYFVTRAMANYPQFKVGLAGLAVLAFLQGGLVTFIVRSNDGWYWPNGTVRSVNHAAQRVLQPVVWTRAMGIPKP